MLYLINKIAEINLQGNKYKLEMNVEGSPEDLRKMIHKTIFQSPPFAEALSDIWADSMDGKEDYSEYFPKKTKIQISSSIFGLSHNIKGDTKSLSSLFFAGIFIYKNLKEGYNGIYTDVMDKIVRELKENCVFEPSEDVKMCSKCSRHKSQHFH